MTLNTVLLFVINFSSCKLLKTKLAISFESFLLVLFCFDFNR